jgi:hypothetical protein
MRTPMLLAGLALAVGLVLPAGAVADTGGTDLPFKTSQSGYGMVNLATGQQHVVGSGPASHFGLTTTEQHNQLVSTGPGTFSWFGTWTATAANGDQMFGTSTGTVSFAADGIHTSALGTYVASGGTGRFADATLTFDATVQGTRLSVEGGIATGSFEATGVGTLSY